MRLAWYTVGNTEAHLPSTTSIGNTEQEGAFNLFLLCDDVVLHPKAMKPRACDWAAVEKRA